MTAHRKAQLCRLAAALLVAAWTSHPSDPQIIADVLASNTLVPPDGTTTVVPLPVAGDMTSLQATAR